LTNKRAEIGRRKRETSLANLRARAEGRAGPSFVDALRAAPMGLIAEVKKKSPSAGVLRDPFDAAAIASAYANGGAQALSVLMDEVYFGGGDAPFQAVRQAVALPLLYKEFVIDEWQVWHAASLGASAALLIVAAMPPRVLRELHAACRNAGLTALVEVHDERETDLALELRPACIGVNNRDLHSFRVSLDTTLRLRARVPRDILLISESGIRTADEVVRLKQAGVNAVLVGEHLLREADLGAAVRGLMGAAWASS
jgi:indole-3-glycerol phosphate synthase